jgi:hypothetical protein
MIGVADRDYPIAVDEHRVPEHATGIPHGFGKQQASQ